MLPSISNIITLNSKESLDLYQNVNTSVASSFTFNNIVVPKSGKLVIAFCGTSASTAIVNSILVDDVNADILVKNGSNEFHKRAIASLNVLAGTKTIVVNLSGNNSGSPIAAIYVWLLNPSNIELLDVFDTGQTTSVTSRTITLDFSNKSFGFYLITKSTTSAISWSNATQKYSVTGTYMISFGDKNKMIAEANNSEIITWSGSAIASALGVTFG